MPGSTRPSMGAIPFVEAEGKGVTFRVWAPFAQSVSVGGSFNNWSDTKHPLESEGNGYWSADVLGNLLGAEYKFSISNKDRDPGESSWRMDPYARQINLAMNGMIVPSTEALAEVPGYETPAWNEMVIYEVHVRTFASDAKSAIKDRNGVPIGTFNSMCAKLDTLKELGINAVELMPLGEFLGDISAGYNPAYIFAIEEEFGGPDGFRNFVCQAHLRGIAVIVDVVYNHLAGGNDMRRFDGWKGAPDGSGIYFYNDWRRETAWGDRFDYGRPEVRSYLHDNAMRWLTSRFADGLRWDSVGSIRNVHDSNNDPGADLADGMGLCRWINDSIRVSQGWKISIAEDLKDNPMVTQPTSTGLGFNAQWGINFFWKLRDAMMAPSDPGKLGGVSWAIGQTFNGDAFQRVIFTESHDGVDGKAKTPMMRIPEAICPGQADSWAAKKLSTLGASVLLTSPGIPMLFMGQEFLSWGEWDDDNVLDWGNSWKFRGIRNLYTDLIHLRRNWFNNTRGLRGQHTNVFRTDTTSGIVAYHRWGAGGPGDDVVVVLNFAERGHDSYNLGLPRGGLWRVRFHSDWNGYDEFFGNWFSYDAEAVIARVDGMNFCGNVGIGPYSALILSQDS